MTSSVQSAESTKDAKAQVTIAIQVPLPVSPVLRATEPIQDVPSIEEEIVPIDIPVAPLPETIINSDERIQEDALESNKDEDEDMDLDEDDDEQEAIEAVQPEPVVMQDAVEPPNHIERQNEATLAIHVSNHPRLSDVPENEDGDTSMILDPATAQLPAAQSETIEPAADNDTPQLDTASRSGVSSVNDPESCASISLDTVVYQPFQSQESMQEDTTVPHSATDEPLTLADLTVVVPMDPEPHQHAFEDPAVEIAVGSLEDVEVQVIESCTEDVVPTSGRKALMNKDVNGHGDSVVVSGLKLSSL